ncbi:MAG: hypothetical protein ACK44U_00845 [Sphingobacteriales bacterium]
MKKDIFRNLMWYVLPDSNVQYPLSLDTVRKIKALNSKGVKVEQLETAEVNTSVKKEVEPQFVDVVGQLSLRSLERNSQKRKQKAREQQREKGGQQQQKQRDHRPLQQNKPRPDGNRPPNYKPKVEKKGDSNQP